MLPNHRPECDPDVLAWALSFALLPTVYREHRCDRLHRNYLTLARCIFWKAETITGDGPWAVPSCTWLTVSLHETEEDARETARFLSRVRCGHRCLGGHRVIQLAVRVGSAS